MFRLQPIDRPLFFVLLALVALLALNAVRVLPLSREIADDRRPPISSQQAEPEKHTGVDKGYADTIPDFRSGSPLYVKAACEHGCGYSEDDKGWWQKLWTDPVATFTAVLAVFTVFLAGATIRAANAAKDAADALPLLERAYVFFNDATCYDISGTIFTLGDITSTTFTVEYKFKNHGRTPALISRVCMSAKYLATGFPDAESVRGGNLPSVLVLGSGDELGPHSQDLPIVGANFEKAKTGDGRLFFWGILEYQDVFRREHKTGICAEWNFGENRFVISKNEKLNYHT